MRKVHYHKGPGEFRMGATLCGRLVDFSSLEGNVGDNKLVKCKICVKMRKNEKSN
jgi:hypothetical protein